MRGSSNTGTLVMKLHLTSVSRKATTKHEAVCESQNKRMRAHAGIAGAYSFSKLSQTRLVGPLRRQSSGSFDQFIEIRIDRTELFNLALDRLNGFLAVASYV